MTTKKLLLAGLVAAISMAGTVQAAVVSIRPVHVAVLNDDFTPVDPALIISHDPAAGATLLERGSKYVLQVDVVMTIGDLQAGQVGFGNAAFNVGLNGLTANDILPGWAADTSNVDSNGTVPGGVVPKWADNGDFGPSGTDLQGIIIGTAPRNFSTTTGANEDPRRTLGIEPYNNPDGTGLPGEYAGSLYLDLSGVAGSVGSLVLDADGGSVYDADGNLSTAGVEAAGGALNFNVVPIPEPSTMVLLGLGSVLLVLARKRG
jgi:hypothetical protein